MLEHETIDALTKAGDLSAHTLYAAEVERLQRFPREEQDELVERARNGDAEARQLLMLNCLRWVLITACRMYEERQPQCVEALDLAAEANLKMVERLDLAMHAHDPVAYLMTVAVRAMRVYCTYHAPLIQRPEWCSLKELARFDPFPPLMTSLDEGFSSPGTTSRGEQIAAPLLTLESDEQREQRTSAHFALLYEAVKRLSRKQRATVVRLYGLFGQPTETLDEIAEVSHLRYRSVVRTASLARRRLHHLLAEHLSQLLRPRPTPERATPVS
jgi:DNA-directed RNA polymerase specialized sigma24 family protein